MNHEKETCQECGKVVDEEEKVVVEKFDSGYGFELTFCSETCANEYYLERLRSAGL